MTEFYQGDQIAYIPNHCMGSDDVEYGFVTGKAGIEGSYFCRYWRKGEPGELRTVANSESTRSENLVHFEMVKQEVIEVLLYELGYRREDDENQNTNQGI